MSTLAIGFVHETENTHKLSTTVPNEIIEMIMLFLYFNGADLGLLTGDIHPKTIMDTLHYRYALTHTKDKSIYTWISTILLAVNPYQQLSGIHHKQKLMKEYIEFAQQSTFPSNKPHPFGTAARCFLRMIARKCNQSIVIFGESGSGKTETVKLIRNYLLSASSIKTITETSIMRGQVEGYSNLLEPFGNASTILNENASRFGIFCKYLYDAPYKASKISQVSLIGLYFETYLLEYSRITSKPRDERNFHIPYLLYYGISTDQHNKYGILHPHQWRYTNDIEYETEYLPVKDAERFQELKEAMNVYQIDEYLQKEIWSVVSAIFNLGNIDFKQKEDGFAAIDDESMEMVHKISKLFGIESKSLIERLSTRSITLKRRIYIKIKYGQAAILNRDSIAQLLYHKLFLYLCERMNACLYQFDDDDRLDAILFIGILDIVGFGNFWDNSLEQFCYNFLNEKLHQFFVYHIIQGEQQEYIKESVLWSPVIISKNSGYITMMEDRHYGFFALLDESCKAPKPTIPAFMQELFKRHSNVSWMKETHSPGSGDVIKPKYVDENDNKETDFTGIEFKHYADTVSYNVSSFQIRNMVYMHPDTAKMLKKSSMTLLKELSYQSKSRRRRSVVGNYHRGIKTLLKNLQATEPSFIHCIKPNMNKSSQEWDYQRIERQLKYNGIDNALKVMKMGYPIRVPYATIYDRYHENNINPLIKNYEPEAFSQAIIAGFGVNEDEYELGLTKIFFKPNKAYILDQIMSTSYNGKSLSKEQDLRITRWVVMRRVQQIIGVCRAFLLLKYGSTV